MKTKSFIIMLLILPSVCMGVYPPIDFYTDGVIQDGNAFSTVRTFDNSIVNMTGGLIEGSLELHDSSIFNAVGGSMNVLEGYASRITLFDNSILNLRNLEGGESYGSANTLIEVAGGANGQINFYGYGFNFEGIQLHGYWADGTSFLFNIRSNQETQDALVFNVVPEPTTIAMFIVGIFCLKRNVSRNKTI